MTTQSSMQHVTRGVAQVTAQQKLFRSIMFVLHASLSLLFLSMFAFADEHVSSIKQDG